MSVPCCAQSNSEEPSPSHCWATGRAQSLALGLQGTTLWFSLQCRDKTFNRAKGGSYRDPYSYLQQGMRPSKYIQVHTGSSLSMHLKAHENLVEGWKLAGKSHLPYLRNWSVQHIRTLQVFWSAKSRYQKLKFQIMPWSYISISSRPAKHHLGFCSLWLWSWVFNHLGGLWACWFGIILFTVAFNFRTCLAYNETGIFRTFITFMLQKEYCNIPLSWL